MSEAKHTPGPWEVWKRHLQVVAGPTKVNNYRELVGGRGSICRCYAEEFGANGTEGDLIATANAHLIAAAPDLLAAAKELRAAFLDGCGDATRGSKRNRLVKAGAALDRAIAKAEGRS